MINYIQYINSHGAIKTKRVVRSVVGNKTKFTISGIQEKFFILSLFQNNIRVFGLELEGIENDDQLAFLNTDIFDLEFIPKFAYFNSETTLVFFVENDYVSLQSSALQFYQKTNEYLFFESYCKTLGIPFLITPFLVHKGTSVYSTEIANLGNDLYYCHVPDSCNIALTLRHVYSGANPVAARDSMSIFTTLVPLDYLADMPSFCLVGYKAVFETPLYSAID